MPKSKRRKSTKPDYTPPPVSSAKLPSPPWYGAVIVVQFFLAVGWIVAYTLFPLPGQTSLGGWNYAIAVVLTVSAMSMLTNWR